MAKKAVSHKTKKASVMKTKGASGKPFAKSKAGGKKAKAL